MLPHWPFANAEIGANQCWGFINGTIVAFVVTIFSPRRMFQLYTISMLCVFMGWTVAMQKVMTASAARTTNNATAIAALFFIFAHICNIGNNVLTYTYLVEHYAYAERPRGIAVQQFFGRGAGLFLGLSQSHCAEGDNLEVLGDLLRMDHL
jgi:hypothetical protein